MTFDSTIKRVIETGKIPSCCKFCNFSFTDYYNYVKEVEESLKGFRVYCYLFDELKTSFEPQCTKEDFMRYIVEEY